MVAVVGHGGAADHILKLDAPVERIVADMRNLVVQHDGLEPVRAGEHAERYLCGEGGHRELGQARVMEDLFPELADALTAGVIYEAGRVEERAVPDGDDGGGDSHRDQVAAVFEGLLADLGDRVWNCGVH